MERSEPTILTPEEVDRRWPRVFVTVLRDGAGVSLPGRLIGRTIEARTRLDVRLEGGEIVQGVAAADVHPILLPRRVA